MESIHQVGARHHLEGLSHEMKGILHISRLSGHIDIINDFENILTAPSVSGDQFWQFWIEAERIPRMDRRVSPHLRELRGRRLILDSSIRHPTESHPTQHDIWLWIVIQISDRDTQISAVSSPAKRMVSMVYHGFMFFSTLAAPQKKI